MKYRKEQRVYEARKFPARFPTLVFDLDGTKKFVKKEYDWSEDESEKGEQFGEG